MALYLVTGGAGFIGSHIASRLVHEGHRLRILDNLSTGRRENLEAIQPDGRPRAWEWIEGDIRDADACRRACAGVDYVFHEAALASVGRSMENPVETTAVNVGGTVNVLAAAREAKAKRVVLASSSSIYGDTPTLPKREDMRPTPLSPYAACKLSGEEFARVFATSLGLPTVSLRYFNVYGPRQDPKSDYAAVIPRFITALLGGKRPQVYGDGHQSRDFTFVEDVVNANLAACTSKQGVGDAMNIAYGTRFSLLDMLDMLGQIIGVKPNPEFLPPRPGDVRDSLADIERAKRAIGFAPRVELMEGLRRTVEFFRRGA